MLKFLSERGTTSLQMQPYFWMLLVCALSVFSECQTRAKKSACSGRLGDFYTAINITEVTEIIIAPYMYRQVPFNIDQFQFHEHVYTVTYILFVVMFPCGC